jgi:hypothetical protein
MEDPRIQRLICELYEINCAGGPLHAALDDGNLSGVIKPWYDHWSHEELDELWYCGWLVRELSPEAPAVKAGLGRSMRSLCEEISAILNAMPEDERVKVVERFREGRK